MLNDNGVLEDPCFDWPVETDNLDEYDERFPFYEHDPCMFQLRFILTPATAEAGSP